MPFLRETPRSLRAYFIVVGILGLLNGLSSSFDDDVTDPLETVHAGLVALFGMCFLLAGLTLPRVLKRGSAGWILKMLVASIVFVAARALLGFVLFRSPLALAGGALPLLVTLYLLQQVRRLAREARPVAPVFD